MSKCLVYEDSKGNCRIVVAQNSFIMPQETEESSIARLHEHALSEVVEFLAVDICRIPQDKTFREAWKKGDCNEPIKIDFQKALEIHRKRIQEAANVKITELNKQLEISIENSNLPEQVSINLTKKILRTFGSLNLSHCKTIEDIKYYIPKELHDVWNYYEPRKI